MTKTVKEEIIEQIDRLGPPAQQRVLEFARGLTMLAGTPGSSLMDFVGCIEPADLRAMSLAIDEGCEKIDSNAW